jgi:hypothetical protein
MPTKLIKEQIELIREYAFTEKDTPGTVNGVDKSRYSFRQKKDNMENTSSNKDTATVGP